MYFGACAHIADDDAVSAVVLGEVERAVGGAHHGIRVAAAFRERGDCT